MACGCCRQCPVYYRGHRVQIREKSGGYLAEIRGDFIWTDVSAVEDYEVYAEACERIDQAIAAATSPTPPPSDAAASSPRSR